jgi:hypothetical protein
MFIICLQRKFKKTIDKSPSLWYNISVKGRDTTPHGKRYKMKIKSITRQYGTEIYEVYDITTETNDQLLQQCGATFFGGSVTRYANNCAKVEVYTD